MTRLDVSFMGRESRPIVVKSVAEIEHDCRWRGVKGLAWGLAISALLWIGIICLWASF